MADDDETATAQPQPPCVQPGQRPDAGADQTRAAQELLAEHVPLALIVDLVTPAVSSEEILATEGLPDEPWWEPESESQPVPGPPSAPVPDASSTSPHPPAGA